jgi:DNA-binding GntR family transcriptional regulator
MTLSGNRGLEPLTRETLQTKVYAELRRAIMGGIFLPGETVTLRRLSEIFGTSIMPVREAVTRLIGERALLMLPNRTVIVPQMTRPRFEDLTIARVLVEQQVVRMAAARIDEKQAAAIERQNDRIREALRKEDWQSALVGNRDFHFMIYEAAGSDVFSHIIEMLWLQVGPFLVFSMKTPSVRWTTEHHLKVINALKARDPDAAADAIAADINESAKHLLEIGIFPEANTPAAAKRASGRRKAA